MLLNKDKEATNALMYLLSKLNTDGIPETREKWQVYRQHIEQIQRAVIDKELKFVVGKKSYPVSAAWLTYAHRILSATTEYYSAGLQELRKKGGGQNG